MSTQRIAIDELLALVTRIFATNGVSAHNAPLVAAAVVAAERDGCTGHGLFRIPGYLKSLESGYVDGKATPELAQHRSSVISADGNRGFAQVTIAAARSRLLDIVRDHGIGCLAIKNSHHYASLANDIEDFAAAGYFAITLINGRARVAPWGAARPVIGTNPIAFACPRSSGPPLLWDLATSAIANADVLMAARDGKAIPHGVAIAADGLSTEDPNAVLNGGALLPFGGHKGGAIAVMIELLAAALTGAHFGFEEAAQASAGGMTSNAGQVIIVIDPAATGELRAAVRVDQLIEYLSESRVDRIPGGRRDAARRESITSGIAVYDKSLNDLQKWIKV